MGRAIDYYSQRVLDALMRTSRQLDPGQQLWRGSAWPHLAGHAWDEPAPLCCSRSRDVAQNFVETPGWPWPDELAAGPMTVVGQPATPSLARIIIGRGVRAVPLAAIMEHHQDTNGILYDRQAIHEQEVTLLACALRVVSVDEDGLVTILAGSPMPALAATG